MQYKKKSNVIGTIAIILVLVLLVGGLGFLSKGFKDWNVKDWFNKVDPIPGGGVVDGDGNELKPGQVYEMPSKMVFTSATGVSLSDGITVSAIITPDVAINKAVDWSVSFVNPSSAWATGKTVSTYVTATPAADGALMATIKCLDAFGEQIKITVTSRDNPNAKADCTADYVKRITGGIPVLKNGSTVVHTFGEISPALSLDPMGNKYPALTFDVNPTFSGSVGTITDTVSIMSFSLSINPELSPLLTRADVADIPVFTPETNLTFKLNKDFFIKVFGSKAFSDVYTFNSICDFLPSQYINIFEFVYTIKGAYSSSFSPETVYATIDYKDFIPRVTDVAFDDSTIIF